MKQVIPNLAVATALACFSTTLQAVPVEIISEDFLNAGQETSLVNYGWSVLVTENANISDYGTQARAIGVGAQDYAFYGPKADDLAPWTNLVPNDPAVASTLVPAGIDITDLVSVKWDSSSDNADHAFHVAVQVGGVWYASSLALNDGFPDSATAAANFRPLEYIPISFATASNWLTIQNATVGAVAPLSLGAGPVADLAGEVTAIGFYLVAGIDNEIAGDHMRFDNFKVVADTAPVPPGPVPLYLQAFDQPDVGNKPFTDYGWSVRVTESGNISSYSPEAQALGIANQDYAFFAPKQDDLEPWNDAVPNLPALATTSVPGSIALEALDSIRWLASGDNIDHEFRVAIQVGGVWYASNPALNDGFPDSGTGTFTPLAYSPESFATASNWLKIENTTVGSPGQLSLGAAPVSDLTGSVTAFGLYLVSGIDDEAPGDHVRFDDFAIWGQPAAPLRITSFTAIGGNVWEVTLVGEATTNYNFYSSSDLTFAPGTLVSSLSQNNPAEDPGSVTGGNLLTTDTNGDGKVRMTLGGGPKDFVRAQSAP